MLLKCLAIPRVDGNINHKHNPDKSLVRVYSRCLFEEIVIQF
jgi:hypothetical protein